VIDPWIDLILFGMGLNHHFKLVKMIFQDASEYL